MTPETARSMYRRFLTDTVSVRRFTGSGPARTASDTPCRARVKGINAGTLVGDVMQSGYTAVVLVEDLITAGFALPLTTGDKLVFHGKELAISFPDNATRAIADELIAYNLQLKG